MYICLIRRRFYLCGQYTYFLINIIFVDSSTSGTPFNFLFFRLSRNLIYSASILIWSLCCVYSNSFFSFTVLNTESFRRVDNFRLFVLILKNDFNSFLIMRLVEPLILVFVRKHFFIRTFKDIGTAQVLQWIVIFYILTTLTIEARAHHVYFIFYLFDFNRELFDILDGATFLKSFLFLELVNIACYRVNVGEENDRLVQFLQVLEIFKRAHFFDASVNFLHLHHQI